jgi:hypothetical protein
MPGRLLDPTVNVPPIVQQGDTVTWIDEPFSDVDGTLYAAIDWNLIFTIIQNGGTTGPLSVTAAPQGSGWLTTLTPTNTQAFVPKAAYQWQVQLVEIVGSIVVTAAIGHMNVVANLATATAGYDGRSLAFIALQQCEANLAAALSGTSIAVLSYKVGTRELRYREVEDIQRAISYWSAKVISEQNKNSIAQNQGNLRKTYFRFPSTFGSSA